MAEGPGLWRKVAGLGFSQQTIEMAYVSLNLLLAALGSDTTLISSLIFQGSRRIRREILLLKEQEESPLLEYGASAASAEASVLRQCHPQAEGCLFAFFLWIANLFEEI